jgi:membrane-associated protein
MTYSKFILYNIVGALLWTALFVYAGYFFGSIQFINDNFSIVVIAIIIISVIPIIFEVIRNSRKKKAVGSEISG